MEQLVQFSHQMEGESQEKVVTSSESIHNFHSTHFPSCDFQFTMNLLHLGILHRMLCGYDELLHIFITLLDINLYN